MFINNPHFVDGDVDVLYHFGMSTLTHDFALLFGDVKFVCCGGSAKRMEKLACRLALEFGLPASSLVNLCSSDRYVMYKAGPVLCVNHGIGVPSMSIMLHELFKLLHHAKCENVLFFRVGTSGGLGVPPGTVVISDKAYNALLEPVFKTECIGKVVAFPSDLDKAVGVELQAMAESLNIPAVTGGTMGTNDFYEGQGRLDGALCCYDKEEKMAFLNRAQTLGIANIEMEASAFAALTHRAGLKAAIVCVTLLNRLEGDQVSTPVHVLKSYEDRPCELLTAFIKDRLQNDACANGGC